jgi:hypothetical protein
MNASLAQWVRKLFLLGNGLTFLGFAISTTLNITFTATLYGYTLNGIGGANEFRAVYMGFWLGLTLGFFLSLKHYRLAILGDVLFAMVLLQSLGRLYSFAVDGIPPTRFILFFALEFVTAGIGLMIRPNAQYDRAAAAEPALA